MHNFNVWTAHSSTYARLDITVGNRASVYFGVYRMNESVNRKEYLDKRFGPDNDSGFLWQGNHKAWGKAHFSRINDSWGGVGDSDQASFEYKSKGSKYTQAHAQLVELAQNFSNLEGQAFEDYVALHINIPLLLKGLASEAVLGHWDGFWGNGNNFFIYIDESEVMHFVPYDTDNTLGTSLLVGDVGESDPLQFASANDAPLLVRKILAIKRYSAEYQGYLKELVTESGLMRQEDSLPWIENVHQLIRDELENDTGDNEVINDRPASWGNESRYRIFTLDSGKNWYETRRNAVLKALGSVENIYATVYYRGVSNNWAASLMEQVEPNIWRITVTNGPQSDATGAGRFKFDINADWSQNLGDDNADGIVDATGADILFTEGEGEYRITFYALDGRYEIDKLNVTVPDPSPDNGSESSVEPTSQSSSGGSSSVMIVVLLYLLLLTRRRMAH
ncbi:CotH kinase family protein [Psychromonas sp. MME1]